MKKLLALTLSILLISYATPVLAEQDYVPVERDKTEVIIATFNVHTPGAGKITKIAAHIKQHAPDIVLLQEITATPKLPEEQNVKKDLVDTDQAELIAKKAGYRYHRFAPTIINETYMYGIGILSKYPISKVVITQYKNSGEPRINLFCEVKMPFGKIGVGNTHFPHTSDAVRAKPYKVLGAFLAKRTHKPVIQGGDFNTFEYLPSEKFPGFEAAATNLKTCGNRRLDNILFTDKFELNYCYKTDARAAKISDHDMVVASLTKIV